MVSQTLSNLILERLSEEAVMWTSYFLFYFFFRITRLYFYLLWNNHLPISAHWRMRAESFSDWLRFKHPVSEKSVIYIRAFWVFAQRAFHCNTQSFKWSKSMWLTSKTKYAWEITIPIEDENASLEVSKMILISNKLKME